MNFKSWGILHWKRLDNCVFSIHTKFYFDKDELFLTRMVDKLKNYDEVY